MIHEPKRLRRDQTSFGVLDYGLMAFGNCLAVYSTGMAVGAPECGQVFLAMIVLGTCFSLALRKWFGAKKFLRVDATLYTIVTISAVLFTVSLNKILPADGIPSDVTTAGWLCWMLSFGSFFSWRDRTLLFQAVPTIALFGLIGCYDTYAPAPFLFFGFLLCLATLLGRSHSRDMLRLAVLSGYFNRADSPLAISEQPEQSADLYEDIKRGPWRWLAGPEWALLSGLVIVVFSVLGAPVIRKAVEPISGAIKVFAPKKLKSNNLPWRAATAVGSYEVGRGPLPNPNATPRPEFRAKFDKIRYLRSSVFDIYSGRGWSSSVIGNWPPSEAGLSDAAIAEMKSKVPFHLSITRLTPSDTIPLPAETIAVEPQALQLTQSGAAQILDPQIETIQISGFESNSFPSQASSDLRSSILTNCLDVSNTNPSVIQFAQDSAGSSGSDYDKAEAIKAAIGVRCKYYKGASAVPQDRDAADYFLNTSQVGYCDLFATAMVECARAIKIPAHFCIGYLPDIRNTDTRGVTSVNDQDYHAWAELYFKGVGWVVFDATEGAESLDPNKPSDSSDFGHILSVILDGLILSVLLIAGAIFIRPKISKRLVVKGPPDRSEIRKVYLRFAKVLFKATRQKRQIFETADEYVARLGPMLAESHSSVEDLNRQISLAMYGPTTPNEMLLKSLRIQVKALSATLHKTRRS